MVNKTYIIFVVFTQQKMSAKPDLRMKSSSCLPISASLLVHGRKIYLSCTHAIARDTVSPILQTHLANPLQTLHSTFHTTFHLTIPAKRLFILRTLLSTVLRLALAMQLPLHLHRRLLQLHHHRPVAASQSMRLSWLR